MPRKKTTPASDEVKGDKPDHSSSPTEEHPQGQGAASPEPLADGTVPAAASVAAPPEPPGSALVAYQQPWTVTERELQERFEAAKAIVNTHALISAGAGFLPISGADLAAMSGSQLWLLKRLSKLYGVPFTDDLARKLLAALLSGFIPLHVAGPLASALKMVPLVGSVVGGLSMVAVGGAVTYAVGLAFVQHFESGGTLLTFEPAKVRAYFESEYRRRLACVLTSPQS